MHQESPRIAHLGVKWRFPFLVLKGFSQQRGDSLGNVEIPTLGIVPTLENRWETGRFLYWGLFPPKLG